MLVASGLAPLARTGLDYRHDDLHDDDRAPRVLALALLRSGLSRHAPADRRTLHPTGSLHESGPVVVRARV
jgi:hypothetical protein